MNVNDLNFKPRCPAESIEKAKNWLVQNKPEFTHLANFVKVSAAEVKGTIGANCHASMASGRGWDCIATEIGATRQAKNWPEIITEDLYRPYVKWLTKDSYFSRFILNRDDDEFIWNHGIIISSDMPSALLQNILISSRYVVECSPDAFKLFNELVKKGYPGSAAFAFCFNTNISYWNYSRRDEDHTLPSTKLEDSTNLIPFFAHRANPVWKTVKEYINFMTGDYGPSLKDEVGHHYRAHPTMFGGSKYCVETACMSSTRSIVDDLLRRNESLREELRASRAGDTSTLSIVNPFKRSPSSSPQVTPDVVTKKELIDIVFPYMQRIGVFSNACC